MGKNPAFLFYPKDWLSDTELQQSAASTRGIWTNLLSHMWFSQERGMVSGTVQELCRLGACTEPEWLIFYEQNCRLKFSDVTFCDGIVTVKNRRMMREEKERESTRLRVVRHRKRESNANVTIPLPVPSTPSTPSSVLPPSPPSQGSSGGTIGGQAKLLLDYWFSTFVERFGSKPTVSGKKDMAIAKQIVTGREIEEAKWLVREHLMNPPDFYERKRLYRLEHVLSAATTLLARKAEDSR